MRASLFGTLAGGSGNPGIQPDAVAGLLGWWKADSLVLSNNDPVSTWADSSVNGRDWTATLTARPLYITNQLNGKPVVRGDGVNDKMTSIMLPSSFSNTVIFVVKNIGTTNGYFLQAAGDGSKAIVSNFGSAIWEYYSTPRTTIGTTSTSVFQIISSQNGTFGDGTAAWQLFNGQSLPVGADLAELIIYDNVISAPDLAGVQQYLATKYAL